MFQLLVFSAPASVSSPSRSPTRPATPPKWLSPNLRLPRPCPRRTPTRPLYASQGFRASVGDGVIIVTYQPCSNFAFHHVSAAKLPSSLLFAPTFWSFVYLHCCSGRSSCRSFYLHCCSGRSSCSFSLAALLQRS